MFVSVIRDLRKWSGGGGGRNHCDGEIMSAIFKMKKCLNNIFTFETSVRK